MFPPAAVHRPAQPLQLRLHYPGSSQTPRLSLTAAHCYEPDVDRWESGSDSTNQVVNKPLWIS